VIITGASSGIGRASAIAVAERGATVFALARNAEALDELIAEIRAAGGQAHAFTCDVTDSTSVEHTVKDILGRFGHVDNLSSAGVQANGPKYSAYLPSKAALDAFAYVVPTETLSDHITFTNIHMPLVKTPMIVPSRRLNPIPPISAEHAAAMVVRGLVDKPPRIDTPVDTPADLGNYLTPKLSRRFLHQLYLGYPHSAAARGVTPAEPSTGVAPSRRPKRPARAVTSLRVPRPIKRAGDWCPACTGRWTALSLTR
jgi:NAD(P)-dependent dehydrogenase (short-subunit alcohol dehydrogenase family)